MEFAKKKATSTGALRLLAEMSPAYTMLRVVLAVTEALASTIFLSLTTASFVDTALLVLDGRRPESAIYLPLILLLIVLGVYITFGSLGQLTDARIRLDIQRRMKPELVHVQLSM